MDTKITISPVTVRPDYVIKTYGDVADRVIRFNKKSSEYIRIDQFKERAIPKSYDEKLQESICRAKSVIMQKTLCNEWDWFITLTLDKKKYQRDDLDKYRKDLTQWLRDRGKAYDVRIHFLLIPEMHKDGSWHMHGLISGIPNERVEAFKRGKHPKRLIDGGYMNWPDYSKKFGFCSLGRIRSQFKTAMYLTKYISKGLNDRAGEKGQHLYLSSRGLNVAQDSSYCYGFRRDLDELLTYHSEFCSTGWVTPVEWWWSMDIGDELANCTEYRPFHEDDDFTPAELSPDFVNMKYEEYENMKLW